MQPHCLHTSAHTNANEQACTHRLPQSGCQAKEVCQVQHAVRPVCLHSPVQHVHLCTCCTTEEGNACSNLRRAKAFPPITHPTKLPASIALRLSIPQQTLPPSSLITHSAQEIGIAHHDAVWAVRITPPVDTAPAAIAALDQCHEVLDARIFGGE
eukprot:scaffold215512_cov28-Tisochrysis_lutea.AAC.1